MTYRQMEKKVIENREKLLKTNNLDEKRRLIRESHELMKKMDACWTATQGKPVLGEEMSMTREEYNEFRYIKSSLRGYTLGPGTTLTIRTDASADYKKRLHNYYTDLGFHPASVRVDNRLFDDRLRIIYIHGLTFDLYGEPHPWTELYTNEERARFAAELD